MIQRTRQRRQKRQRQRQTRRRQTKRQKRQKRQTKRRMRGGNYQTDVTTTQLEGVSTKDLKDVIVSGPGFVLSGAAYLDLMESRDRNGTEQS